jgi:MFS family permease
MRKRYPYITKGSFILFLVFSFLMEFVPVYPVYMIIFDSRGYGFTGLSWLMVIWCVPVVLLELPSGVLADRLSRKALIAGGMGFKILCYLLWSVSSRYAAAAFGFVCWGIQEAFCSGSQQALLYENLRDEGDEADYEAAAGICGAASTAGVIGALVYGGLIYA